MGLTCGSGMAARSLHPLCGFLHPSGRFIHPMGRFLDPLDMFLHSLAVFPHPLGWFLGQGRPSQELALMDPAQLSNGGSRFDLHAPVGAAPRMGSGSRTLSWEQASFH